MQIDIQAARDNLAAGKFDLAAEQYQYLIAQSPSHFELFLELSSALMGANKYDEALVVVKQLEGLNLAIDHEIQLQIGNIYLAQNRLAESVNRLQPLLGSACDERARTALSSAYLNIGKPSKASHVLEALDTGTLSIGATNNLAISLCEQMQVERGLTLLVDCIKANQYDWSTISNLLMLSNYTEAPNESISVAKAAIQNRVGGKSGVSIPSKSKKSLRIGFISGDIYQHPVGWFLIGPVRELTKKSEVVIYCTSNKRDQLTDEFSACGTELKLVDGMNEDALSELIRRDNIDMLIDLSGHTAQNKASLFTRRIAPVQLSYLGYFASTHLPEMDGAIFDAEHLRNVPPAYFSEAIYQLGCSRFCYTPPNYAPAVGSLPLDRNGIITFCSFSNTSKMSKACISLWANTLQAVPNSRIQIRWKTIVDSSLRDSIRKQFNAHGIEDHRVELYADCDHESLFHFYNEVDIALDTYPFSGATTTCESLWMGVPVITMTGNAPASNQSASILNQIGLHECIAHNADEFVTRAKELAGNRVHLDGLRNSMRSKITSTPLGNPELFSAHFYPLLETIWQKYSQ